MYTEAETSFGISILQQFPLNESVVLSPISIALALSLVHLGAKGETKKQIGNAICKGANDDQLKQHYSFLSKSLMSPANDIEVNLANKAYFSSKYPVKKSYLAAIESTYNASSENIDVTQPVKAAEAMNGFVKERTKGRIPKIVDVSDIDVNTAGYLINAFFFEAKWLHSFPVFKTFEGGTFYSKEGVTKKVVFISDREVYRDYSESDEVQVLSLKYKNTDYTFEIFLPKEKYGLAKFIKGLTGAKFQELLSKQKETYINVRIPRMHLKTSTSLNSILKTLGVTNMFEEDADLSEISDVPTYVSKVRHETIMELDEIGTRAAAMTSVKMLAGAAMGSGGPKPIDFDADHPYLFAITFKKHPLFLGTFI